MPRSLQFEIAQERTDGQTRALVEKYRKVGVSWDRIAARLYAEHDVEVSGVTIATWAREWGIE